MKKSVGFVLLALAIIAPASAAWPVGFYGRGWGVNCEIAAVEAQRAALITCSQSAFNCVVDGTRLDGWWNGVCWATAHATGWR